MKICIELNKEDFDYLKDLLMLDKNEEVAKNETVFETRSEAEEILNSMQETIMKYGSVTITMVDFLELTNQPYSYRDINVGWTDLSDACVCRTKPCLVIKMKDAHKLRI